MQRHSAGTRPPPPGPRRPPGRYGTPPSRRRRMTVRIGGAAVAALVLVLFVRVAYRHATPAVTAEVRSYLVLSPSAVRVTIAVHKAPQAVARCVLRAKGPGFADVARTEITVPARADGGRTTVLTSRLVTSAPAVNGEVEGCRLVRPG